MFFELPKDDSSTTQIQALKSGKVQSVPFTREHSQNWILYNIIFAL